MLRGLRVLSFMAVWAMLLCAGSSPAQQYPTRLVPGSPKDIALMMQDSRSRIWLGTLDDLLIFDGVRFYSLRQYGYPREKAQSLAEDSEGGIWAGTIGGLYRYQNGRVEKILPGTEGGFGIGIVAIAPGTMLAAYAPPEKKRPVNTFGLTFLYRIQRDRGVWKAEAITDRIAGSLSADKDGNALFNCPDGWCELKRQQVLDWDSNRQLLRPIQHGTGAIAGRILRDRFGCTWIRGQNDADYQCPGDSAPKGVPETAESIDSAMQISEGPDGAIAMTGPFGVGRPGAFHFAGPENGVPVPSAILAARDGTIWLADSEGLKSFVHPFQIEHWTARDGLENMFSFVRVGDNIYAGGGNGIVVLDKSRSRWNPLVGKREVGVVLDLIRGPGDTMYAASTHGLSLVRNDGRILASTGGADGGIRVIQTPDGQVWLGGGHLDRVSIVGSKVKHEKENLPGTVILDMETGPNGSLWLCNSEGLFIKEAHGREAGGKQATGDEHGWKHIGSKDGLAENSCFSLAVEPNGDAWYGYHTLKQFARISNALSGPVTVQNFSSGGHVGEAPPTPLDVDRRGWLWRGGDTAMYLATAPAAKAGEWLRLDEQDGFPDPDTNQQALFVDDDGSIWLGGGGSTVTHFQPPPDFATTLPRAEAFLSGFTLGNGAPELAEAMPAIPHGATVVAHLGSLLFDRRHAMHLRYRMLPEQKEWKETEASDLPLGKLSSGTHTLELQAQMAKGHGWTWKAVPSAFCGRGGSPGRPCYASPSPEAARPPAAFDGGRFAASGGRSCFRSSRNGASPRSPPRSASSTEPCSTAVSRSAGCSRGAASPPSPRGATCGRAASAARSNSSAAS
jgi:ligand-binding sensor domain-containing protein